MNSHNATRGDFKDISVDYPIGTTAYAVGSFTGGKLFSCMVKDRDNYKRYYEYHQAQMNNQNNKSNK